MLREAQAHADRLGQELTGEEGDGKEGGEGAEEADGDRVRDQGNKAGSRGRGASRGRRLTGQGGGGEARVPLGGGASAAALQQQVAVQEEKVGRRVRLHGVQISHRHGVCMQTWGPAYLVAWAASTHDAMLLHNPGQQAAKCHRTRRPPVRVSCSVSGASVRTLQVRIWEAQLGRAQALRGAAAEAARRREQAASAAEAAEGESAREAEALEELAGRLGALEAEAGARAGAYVLMVCSSGVMYLMHSAEWR